MAAPTEDITTMLGALGAGDRSVLPRLLPLVYGELREVAARKPASLGELSAIEGIGDTKLERHGESLLAALASARERDDAPAA